MVKRRGSTDEGRDRFRRELARGTFELALLSILRPARRYGYELLTLLNDLTDGAPEVKEGTLYPLLHRLEDAGFIASSWETHERSAPRKYYTLTAAGKAQQARLETEWQELVAGIGRVLAAKGTR
jgi:PadR family transcriptional regulator PadR